MSRHIVRSWVDRADTPSGAATRRPPRVRSALPPVPAGAPVRSTGPRARDRARGRDGQAGTRSPCATGTPPSPRSAAGPRVGMTGDSDAEHLGILAFRPAGARVHVSQRGHGGGLLRHPRPHRGDLAATHQRKAVDDLQQQFALDAAGIHEKVWSRQIALAQGGYELRQALGFDREVRPAVGHRAATRSAPKRSSRAWKSPSGAAAAGCDVSCSVSKRVSLRQMVRARPSSRPNQTKGIAVGDRSYRVGLRYRPHRAR